MTGAPGSPARSAWRSPDGSTATYIGQAYGRIAPAPHGAGGFGYDPVFIPDGYEQSYAELGPAVKDKISHRAQAIAQLKAALAALKA